MQDALHTPRAKEGLRHRRAQAVKGSRTNSEGGLTGVNCEEVWRAKRKAGQWAEVRLSPAGDGAEDAEETCEKQKRPTWWMDVLVGGSGQGLFTWETRSSRSVTSSFRQGRVQQE